MTDFEFRPATIRVPPGARVTFVNLDGQVHTATSVAPGFDTGNIEPDADGTIVAPREPGEYPFYCVHHAAIGESGAYEGMVGSLVIEDAGAGPRSARTPAPGTAMLVGVTLAVAIFLRGPPAQSRNSGNL